MNLNILDFDQIASITEMDYEDVVQLIQIYEQELERDLKKLEQRYIQKQFHEIGEIAHKMKGDSSNLALKKLELLSKDIEKKIRENENLHLETLIQQLWAYHALIQRSLNAIDLHEKE